MSDAAASEDAAARPFQGSNPARIPSDPRAEDGRAASRRADPPRFARLPLRLLAGVLLGLAGLAALGVRWSSERVLEQRYPRPMAAPASVFDRPVDAALLERGRHLVTEVAQCTFCHGPDLAGREMADDPFIGRLHAPNLTRGRGGVGGRLSDADWLAALRRGVASDGRSLLLMPSGGLARLSDRDLAAVVAYVRQVPAVDRARPPRRVGWLTRVVVAAGLAPDLISADQAESVVAAGDPLETRASRRYGEYLVAVGGCRVCHRADLGGGLHPLSLPGEPPPSDLTPRGRLADWSLTDFTRAMREGRTPDGGTLDRRFMPWPAFSGLDDVEIEAIWRYLATVESPEA